MAETEAKRKGGENVECDGDVEVGAEHCGATPHDLMITELSDKSLLRGMPAFHAVSGCARIFKDGGVGSEGSFDLSSRVDRIRWFISHNWSVDRLEKFAVLSWHFNLVPALLITALFLLLVFALTALGRLPLLAIYEHHEALPGATSGAVRRVGACAQASATFVFLASLFTWHEVGGRLGLISSPCFLDKACISQTDVGRRVKGIQSLAAFLAHTDNLLVLYTDVYLRRMWTVFELASVLILEPGMRVKVVPTFLPAFVVAGSLVTYLAFLFQLVWTAQEVRDALDFRGFAFVIVAEKCVLEFIFCVYLRRLARKEISIRASAEAFCIRDAGCYDEHDRALVCNSIAFFMASRGHVPPGASHDDCLAAFDSLVRREVPRFIVNSIGQGGLPYHVIVIIFLPICSHLVDRTGAAIYQGERADLVVQTLAYYLCVQLLYVPSWAKLASLTMRRCLQLEKWCDAAFTAAMGLMLTVAGLVGEKTLAHFAFRNDELSIVINTVLWGCLAALTTFLYGGARACPCPAASAP